MTRGKLRNGKTLLGRMVKGAVFIGLGYLARRLVQRMSRSSNGRGAGDRGLLHSDAPNVASIDRQRGVDGTTSDLD